MEALILFIGGTGFGSIGLVVVQHFLNRNAHRSDRKIQERKEAYAGFIEAITMVRNDENVAEKDVKLPYWAARVQLVCSEELFRLIDARPGSGRKSLMSQTYQEGIVAVMRKDLGITA